MVSNILLQVLLKALYNGAAGLKNGKITGAEFIDQLASGLSGTGIMLLGMFLASKGIIRTNDDDSDRKERFDSDMGSQDYAISLPFWNIYDRLVVAFDHAISHGYRNV